MSWVRNEIEKRLLDFSKIFETQEKTLSKYVNLAIANTERSFETKVKEIEATVSDSKIGNFKFIVDLQDRLDKIGEIEHKLKSDEKEFLEEIDKFRLTHFSAMENIKAKVADLGLKNEETQLKVNSFDGEITKLEEQIKEGNKDLRKNIATMKTELNKLPLQIKQVASETRRATIAINNIRNNQKLDSKNVFPTEIAEDKKELKHSRSKTQKFKATRLQKEILVEKNRDSSVDSLDMKNQGKSKFSQFKENSLESDLSDDKVIPIKLSKEKEVVSRMNISRQNMQREVEGSAANNVNKFEKAALQAVTAVQHNIVVEKKDEPQKGKVVKNDRKQDRENEVKILRLEGEMKRTADELKYVRLKINEYERKERKAVSPTNTVDYASIKTKLSMELSEIVKSGELIKLSKPLPVLERAKEVIETIDSKKRPLSATPTVNKDVSDKFSEFKQSIFRSLKAFFGRTETKIKELKAEIGKLKENVDKQEQPVLAIVKKPKIEELMEITGKSLLKSDKKNRQPLKFSDIVSKTRLRKQELSNGSLRINTSSV